MWKLIASVAVMASCGAPRFEMPITAAQAVAYDSGDALVAYLSQRDANAAVCDLHATATPHVARLTPGVRDALVTALRDGAIQPAVWKRCATTLVTELPA